MKARNPNHWMAREFPWVILSFTWLVAEVREQDQESLG